MKSDGGMMHCRMSPRIKTHPKWLNSAGGIASNWADSIVPRVRFTVMRVAAHRLGIITGSAMEGACGPWPVSDNMTSFFGRTGAARREILGEIGPSLCVSCGGAFCSYSVGTWRSKGKMEII